MLGAILLVLFLVTQACIAASADGDRQSAPPSSPATSSSPAAGGTPTVDASVDAPSGEPDGESGGDGDSTSATGDTDVSGAAPGLGPTDEVARCADEDMEVVASAEQVSFTEGSSVTLDIEVRNGTDEACRRDVGSGQRELFLRRANGADRVWSSRDCVELSDENEQVLSPDSQTHAWVEWNGRASSECDGPQPDGDLVTGEFELVARLGTVHSDPVEITIE